VQTAFDNTFYFQVGPLVYALDIPANEKITKKYTVPGFYDYYHTPKNRDYVNMRLIKQKDYFGFSFERKDLKTGNPWSIPESVLMGKMKNRDDTVEVQLIPMGCTLLRRVTFR